MSSLTAGRCTSPPGKAVLTAFVCAAAAAAAAAAATQQGAAAAAAGQTSSLSAPKPASSPQSPHAQSHDLLCWLCLS